MSRNRAAFSITLILLAGRILLSPIQLAQASALDLSQLPGDLAEQVQADLDVLSKVQGNSASLAYRQIFSSESLNGGELLEFFKSRIKSAAQDECGGSPGLVACIQPDLSTDRMWITSQYTTLSLPQVYRISVLLHESRHTEEGDFFWMHAKCPASSTLKGIFSGTPLAGKPACDKTVMGSYGLQAALLNSLAKCTNCSEKFKADAKLYGDDTSLRIISAEERDKLQTD